MEFEGIFACKFLSSGWSVVHSYPAFVMAAGEYFLQTWVKMVVQAGQLFF